MKIPCIWLACVLCATGAMAQKQDIVSAAGTAQIEWLNTISRQEVEKMAEDQAIVNALERAFGTVIMKGNYSYIKNVQTGEMVQTNTVFNMIGSSYVAGELISVLDKRFENIEGKKTVDGKTKTIVEVRCTVKIKARKLTEAPVNFDALPLACSNPKCRNFSFHDEDTLYLWFKSPASGFLSVFLDDNTNAYRLLPYREMPEKYEDGIPVEADKPYTFFSPAQHYFGEDSFLEDTYVLTTSSQQEVNRIFVIFSKTRAGKPGLHSETDNAILTEEEADQGFSLPLSLPSDHFQRWLQKIRSYNKTIQLKVIDITISK